MGKNVQSFSNNMVSEKYILMEQTPFEYSESYKSLRTNVMYAVAVSPRKSNCVIVTSSMPDECKSTVSANLAISLSQLGIKVLLIDTDLRNSTQHHIFKVKNTRGLSQVIVGLAKFEDVVFRDVVPNLDLLTAGSRVVNPSELLGSENMDEILPEISRYYDYVIIDTPPVNVVTDAMMLVHMSAGVILTVREGYTSYSNIDSAVASIKMTNTPILGMVLSDSKSSPTGNYGKHGRYGRYGKYGKYGYGYGYGQQPDKSDK